MYLLRLTCATVVATAAFFAPHVTAQSTITTEIITLIPTGVAGNIESTMTSVYTTGYPPPAPAPYKSGTCAVDVTQWWSDQNVSGQGPSSPAWAISVGYLRDDAGKAIGGPVREVSDVKEGNKIDMASQLPLKFLVWKRDGNDGMEFRYGESKWNTNKKFWSSDKNVLPRLDALEDWKVDEFMSSVRPTQKRVAKLYFEC